jgi:alkylated DNA repair protein (DNA oxidative demethylase)
MASRSARPHRPSADGDLLASFRPERESLSPGATLLRGFAAADIESLVREIETIATTSPFRRMETPGGGRMSVAMTSAGLGWVTDRRGYRYDAIDPDTGRPWPAIPDSFAQLARRAASVGGFEGFSPDGCLINRYEPGAKMGLHQDKDERDSTQPIVSVSLGLPATFLWGGARRGDRTRRIPLASGDVVVWGGMSRYMFHGVTALAEGFDPVTGGTRYNLTFRRAR